jgi:hypothetical protein
MRIILHFLLSVLDKQFLSVLAIPNIKVILFLTQFLVDRLNLNRASIPSPTGGLKYAMLEPLTRCVLLSLISLSHFTLQPTKRFQRI